MTTMPMMLPTMAAEATNAVTMRPPSMSMMSTMMTYATTIVAMTTTAAAKKYVMSATAIVAPPTFVHATMWMNTKSPAVTVMSSIVTTSAATVSVMYSGDVESPTVTVWMISAVSFHSVDALLSK